MQKISVKTIYLILVISIGLVGLGVGSTFAMFTASSKIDNPISFTAGIFGESDVIETVEVTVPAGETKATNLHVTNSTNSNLNYVMWYIDEGLDIELGSKRTDSGTYQTTIDAGEEHQYEVSIRNNSNSDVTVVIGVSSGTGSVTLSSDMKMVPQSELKLKPTLASVITNLYNNSTKTAVPNNSITYQYDTTNNLMKDTAGNIRYYGASPNNYVYFNCDSYPSTNCELWRIIGVFDGKIKLIRNKTIDLYSWDNKNKSTGAETAYGKNDWTTARLMKLLNPSTYYTTDANDNGKGQSLYWNATSGACYSGQNNATISCNFTSTGIKDTTRNMIAETTWNLVGWNTSDIYSNVMYEKERGTTTVSNPSDGITRATTWTGKIALPYPSDYGYATDLSKCSQTLFNYNSGTDSYACRSNDWMYSIITNSGINDGWLLTPYSGYAYMAFGVHSSGYVNGYGVYTAFMVAPVLYLGSDQDIVSGDGSQSNPYQLANS
ncbi:MAG: hypothetical protein U0K48_04435 [Bacilli bacterium]|nr:hypothetical protein [Bacilli bacterium]